MAPSPPAPVVSLRGVGKMFGTGTLALDGLDLDVREGEFLSLLGPSGCGKSTALRIIAGLSEPSRGTVAWKDGGAVGQARSIGFVFQEPTLMPWTTVFGNVFLPLKLAGVDKAVAARTVRRHADAGVDRARARHRAAHSLDG
jgi:NitT/TauT family transport system ATP-binding protein